MQCFSYSYLVGLGVNLDAKAGNLPCNRLSIQITEEVTFLSIVFFLSWSLIPKHLLALYWQSHFLLSWSRQNLPTVLSATFLSKLLTRRFFLKAKTFPGLTDLGLVIQGGERSVHRVKPMWLNTLSLLCTWQVPTLLVPRSPHPSKEMKMHA